MITRLSKAKARGIFRRIRVSFREVVDPRRQSQVVYPLWAVLNTIVLGFTTGEGTLRQIELFVANLPIRLRRALGFKDKRTPSDTVFYKLLERLDPTGLRRALVEQVKQALKSKAVRNDLFPFGVVSCDGTSGTKDWGIAPNPQCQQYVSYNPPAPYWYQFALRVHLISSSTRVCLDQMFLRQGTGESTGFRDIIPRVVKDFPKLFRAIMADATYTSKQNAQMVLELNKAYIFALKANLRRLYTLAVATLSDLPVVARTEERYQGATIIRELRRAPCPTTAKFPGAQQFWSVTQCRINSQGKRSVEVRYFVTSLGWDELKDAHVLRLVRLHWGIENNGNWTMDLIFDDDRRCPCKKGWGPSVVSWLRLLAFNFTAITRVHLPKHDKDHWTPWHSVQQLIAWALMIFGGDATVEI